MFFLLFLFFILSLFIVDFLQVIPTSANLEQHLYSTAPIFKGQNIVPDGTGFFMSVSQTTACTGEVYSTIFVTALHLFVEDYSKDDLTRWQLDTHKKFSILLHKKKEELIAPHTDNDTRRLLVMRDNVRIPLELSQALEFPQPNELRQQCDVIAFPFFDSFAETVYFSPIPTSWPACCPATPLENIPAFTRVVVFGYPDGLWDDFNNLPIPRQGCLSLPTDIDFRGELMGIINVGCYGGDSGAPVFAIVPSSMHGDDSFVFLGLHADGPEPFAKTKQLVNAVGFFTKRAALQILATRHGVEWSSPLNR